MLVTHLCHRTGLVNPVKEIIALARQHGVACILDTAQAVGQMPVDVKEIDADFAGSVCTNGWVRRWVPALSIYARAGYGDSISAWATVRTLPTISTPASTQERITSGPP